MSLSKSELLFTTMVFYIILSLFVGFWNTSFSDNTLTGEEKTLTDNNKFNFLPSIITGYTELPLWLNIALFVPLTITLLFVVITSLPTFNGGS